MDGGYYAGQCVFGVPKTQILELPFEAHAEKTVVLDQRILQARTLWDSGWGRGRFPSFEVYLMTIPQIPTLPFDGRFVVPILVDISMRLPDACRLLGIEFGGEESVFTIPPSRAPDAEAYWMWVNLSPGNRGCAPYRVVQIHSTFERALIAYEGIALVAQYPQLLCADTTLCLAGSRLCSYPTYCACLLMVEGQPTLGVTEYCAEGITQETPLRWG